MIEDKINGMARAIQNGRRKIGWPMPWNEALRQATTVIKYLYGENYDRYEEG